MAVVNLKPSGVFFPVVVYPATIISGIKDGLQGGPANYITAAGSALSTLDTS